MAEAPVRTKLVAGCCLICVQVSVGVLYKISQGAAGGFHYSTMSAIAIAEFVKLGMSMSFHVLDDSHREEGAFRVATACRSASSQLSRGAVLEISILAVMYAINNQLYFFVITMVDPGTTFLFKAASTLITATLQTACYGKTFSLGQWKAMVLQGIGMIIVQKDPCRNSLLYAWLAYAVMSGSAVLTSLCTAKNEYLVKNYKVGLNVQNSTLYAGGAVLNVLAHFVLPNPSGVHQKGEHGFFHGFDQPLAVAVVVANSFIGLAITAVYKYADAITKCIASDCTAVVLCILSTIFFNLKASLTMWCGVAVVVFAVHLYTDAASAAAATPKAEDQRPVVSAADEDREEDDDRGLQDKPVVLGRGGGGV